MNRLVKAATPIAIAATLCTIPVSAQDRESRRRPAAPAAPEMKTASEAYWDAVRASTGPIGFPQAVPDEQLPWRDRVHARRFNRVFAPGPFVAPPAPVYVPVPVYVPGPPVYVPVPAPAAPVADTPAVVAPAAPLRPEKFYIIPGCYAGNRPPQRKTLPAGCDIHKLQVNTW